MTNIVHFPKRTPDAIEGLKRFAEKIKRKEFEILDREWQNENVYNYKDVVLHGDQEAEKAHNRSIHKLKAIILDKIPDIDKQPRVVREYVSEILIKIVEEMAK